MQPDMRTTIINLCDLYRSQCHGTNTGQQFRHTQAIETTFKWYHQVQRSSLLSLILKTEPFYTVSSFFSHQGLIHTRPAFSCPIPIAIPYPLFSFTVQLISIFFLMHMSKFILTPFLVSLFFFFFCKSYSRLIWEGKYSIYLGIKITLTIVEKFYSFIEKIVIWHFLSARHSSRFQKFSCERARHIPCPHGAYSVVKETM